MESLFFNITDTNYKVKNILKLNREVVKRVDISNGILFFQIDIIKRAQKIKLKNIDRMLIFIVVEKGKIDIRDNISKKIDNILKEEVGIFVSSIQDINIDIIKSKHSKAILIFIADFFLKRYLSYNKFEPIDFIYNKLQKEISLETISKEPLDALSIYIINNLLNIPLKNQMQSIRAEHKILEFIIHRLSLLHINKPTLTDESYFLASRAKDILTKEYINPPTIKILAHRCATNETKLKKVFKEIYHITPHEYIQKFRLKEANLLLKEDSLTVGEVAKKVGYKHQGYFSKLFFKTYGVYPIALIKKSFSC